MTHLFKLDSKENILVFGDRARSGKAILIRGRLTFEEIKGRGLCINRSHHCIEFREVMLPNRA